MAQRLQAAKRAAAARGELRTPLPVGYVHDELGAGGRRPRRRGRGRDPRPVRRVRRVRVGLRGGRRVRRAAVPAARLRRGVGRAAALGPADPCPGAGRAEESVLRRRVRARPLHLRRTVDPDGSVHTGLVERPRAQWPVLIRDHHDGYIGWADYLANEARLAANRTNTGARPPREGSALCQGIIACGSCGKPMRTNYHSDQRPAYECSAPRRSAHHPDLPLGHRGHRRRRGRRAAAGGVDPDRGRAGAGRRRRGRRPAPAPRSRRRTGRRTRPLRSRPRRTRLPRCRTGKPVGRTHPRDSLGSPTRRPGRGRTGARRRTRHAAAAARPSRTRAAGRRPARRSGTRRPPATRTANGCCAP